MAKDTYYFTHDYNTRSDSKIKRLILKHGMAGYGAFWSIIEDLYNNANALPLDYELIAFELRIEIETVKSIINDFNLFVIDGDCFGSTSVENRLNQRNEKSLKAKRSAELRWKDKKEKDANALQAQTDSNPIKERKGKEIKEKEIKDKEIDNTLMSEIKISDVPENEMEYFNIANFFYLLFKRNSEEVLKVKWSHLDKTKYKKCINPIRLLLTNDNRTIEELQSVYKFLQTDSFWMGNIQTTEKLREKFDQLITKTSSVILNNLNNGTNNKTQPTADEKLNARKAANRERLMGKFGIVSEQTEL